MSQQPSRKFNVLYDAPVLNRSGYGQISDLLVKPLLTYPLFNLGIKQMPWGNCQPRQTSTTDDELIKSRIIKAKEIPAPDIYITHTLPHLVKPVGKIYNICISAGVETDEAYDYIMKAVNEWDLNIAPSAFTKQVYLNSDIKPTKPIEVLNWCADTDIFNINAEPNANVDKALAGIAEQEAFLFVGQFTSSNPFGDRKDMANLILTFCKAFQGKSNRPALILKTSGVNYSTFDRNSTIERIKGIKDMLPNNDVSVYLLHGELTDSEMNALYNHKKVIANISFTHAEGYGIPLLQASLSGKPVIAPNYSGHLDFLDSRAILLDGKLETIPDHLASEFFIKGSKWFNVDYEKATKVLQDFYYGDRTKLNASAVSLANDNAKKFNLQRFEKNIHKILDRYLLGKI